MISSVITAYVSASSTSHKIIPANTHPPFRESVLVSWFLILHLRLYRSIQRLVNDELEMILKEPAVVSPADYQQHLSERLRKPKVSSAKIVGVPNDIQVGRLPYIKPKL